MKESEESFGGKPATVRVGRTLKMASAPSWPKGNDEGGKFVDRNLVPLRSAAQQNSFAPTPQVPVRMRFKMGGGC